MGLKEARKRERERESVCVCERERERERESVCVCVCVVSQQKPEALQKDFRQQAGGEDSSFHPRQ